MTPPPRASVWDWFAWWAAWGCSNLLTPRLSPSQHLKSCKKWFKTESYILPTGGAASILTIEFWNFGCAGEKQTPVSEAWSGQRPRCSWNLGIVPGLGRTLEVWGFGRWWGVRNWFKTQPFLTCLSSKKRQKWKCKCIASCVGQVARCSSYLFREENKRCPVTRWASKASRTPRLADWGWALSHKKTRKKLTFYEILVGFHGGSISWVVILTTERGTSNFTTWKQCHRPRTKWCLEDCCYDFGCLMLLVSFYFGRVSRPSKFIRSRGTRGNRCIWELDP